MRFQRVRTVLDCETISTKTNGESRVLNFGKLLIELGGASQAGSISCWQSEYECPLQHQVKATHDL